MTAAAGTDADDARLRRVRMRSWRRGTKEMDLILGPYADARLADLDPPTLDLYESLLEEADGDLYMWVSGTAEPPDRFSALIADVRNHVLNNLTNFRR